MEASKKVIILDNIKSKRIAQAIFVLNEGAVDEFSAVKEAERLVEAYLNGMPLKKRKRGISRKNLLIAFAVSLFVCAVICAFWWLL